MKAMLATQWCDPPDPGYADVPAPTPGPAELPIEVEAIGCNFPDILIIQGKYQSRPPLPFAPSGDVHAVGPGAGRFRPGDRVVAPMSEGAYAEAVAVPEAQVHALPATLSFGEGAAFAVVARGTLRPVIWKTFSLARAAHAPGAIGPRESYGEVVLIP